MERIQLLVCIARPFETLAEEGTLGLALPTMPGGMDHRVHPRLVATRILAGCIAYTRK